MTRGRVGVTDDTKKYICSVTGFRCGCEPGRGCAGSSRGPSLDPPPAAALQLIKSARVLIESAQALFEEAMSELPFDRAFPNPELRQINARLKTALVLIEEVCE